MFRILFADDDAAMRLMMKRVLSFEYHVEVAECGDDARAMLEAATEPFAVILADMSMARGDGVELFRAARQIAPESTRLLLTGDHLLSLKSELLAGADPFQVLAKPLDNASLMAAIRAGVAHHTQQCIGV